MKIWIAIAAALMPCVGSAALIEMKGTMYASLHYPHAEPADATQTYRMFLDTDIGAITAFDTSGDLISLSWAGEQTVVASSVHALPPIGSTPRTDSQSTPGRFMFSEGYVANWGDISSLYKAVFFFYPAGQGGQYLLSGTVEESREIATPVPEPSTLALLGLGLAAFGWKRRKS